MEKKQDNYVEKEVVDMNIHEIQYHEVKAYRLLFNDKYYTLYSGSSMIFQLGDLVIDVKYNF